MSAPIITCRDGHVNPAARKFCGECGLSLVGICPNGHENPEGRRYCGECGSPLQGLAAADGPLPASAPVGSDRTDIGQEAEFPPLGGDSTRLQSTGSALPVRPRRYVRILAAAGVTVAFVIGFVTLVATNQGGPVVLPFTELGEPTGVAVDSSGAVYVADPFNYRVLKLAPGSSDQTVLAFPDLSRPGGVAVGSDGAVYVTDVVKNQVLKLSAGSREESVLPFTNLNNPRGIAVDYLGAVYIADTANRRVLKLAAGSSEQKVLPFTDLGEPVGVAIDSGGAVYVADRMQDSLLKLPAGSGEQTVLPSTDYPRPIGVAVGSDGAVYFATDEQHGRVVKLSGGSDRERLRLSAYWPGGVAVGSDAIYVTDTGGRRVLKIPEKCITDSSPSLICSHVNVVRSVFQSWR